MDTIDLIVNALPVAQMRPKLVRQCGHFRLYDPSSGFKKLFVKDVLRQCPDLKPDSRLCSVKVEYGFNYQAKTLLDKSLLTWNLFQDTIRKDIDNLLKFTFDALNGIVWSDDKQIISVDAKKLLCNTNYTSLKVFFYDKNNFNKKQEVVLKHFTKDDFLSLQKACAQIATLEPEPLKISDPIAFFAVQFSEQLTKIKKELLKNGVDTSK